MYGYYPTDENGDGYGKGELMSSKGDMQIETRAQFDANYTSDGVTDFTLEITESQATKLTTNLESKVTNPGTYSLAGNQCTSVAASAITGAGVKLQEYHYNHGDPGPSPLNSWLLSPSGLKGALNHSVNSGIVTKKNSYGGN